MTITTGELMTALAASTSMWSMLVPGLDSVKDTDLVELRQHEVLAGVAVVGAGFTVSLVAKDATILGVSVVILIGLLGLYEWKIWSTKMPT